MDRPTVGHFSAGEIMHTAIGSSLRISQEQAMEVAFRALKRHGVVSEHTTVQFERCLWDQIELRLGRMVVLRQLLFAAYSTFTKAKRPAQECSSGVCRTDSLQGSLTGPRVFWQRGSSGSFPGRS